jgi:hypothetical protein
MKCPYCKSTGIARDTDVYSDHVSEHWICVKCPNPITYSTNDKKIAIWVLFNESWYSIVYMNVSKVYIVRKESFNLRINDGESKEEYAYDGETAIQLPSDETVTPENAQEKLALWLTFS